MVDRAVKKEFHDRQLKLFDPNATSAPATGLTGIGPKFPPTTCANSALDY
jgi:hypothetical protein